MENKVSFKENWPAYLGYTFLVTPLLTAALYFGYQNDKERWSGKQEETSVKEVCYDKNTGQEVRLMPLDIQQINSRAGRNSDGLWKDLECRVEKK